MVKKWPESLCLKPFNINLQHINLSEAPIFEIVKQRTHPHADLAHILRSRNIAHQCVATCILFGRAKEGQITFFCPDCPMDDCNVGGIIEVKVLT